MLRPRRRGSSLHGCNRNVFPGAMVCNRLTVEPTGDWAPEYAVPATWSREGNVDHCSQHQQTFAWISRRLTTPPATMMPLTHWMTSIHRRFGGLVLVRRHNCPCFPHLWVHGRYGTYRLLHRDQTTKALCLIPLWRGFFTTSNSYTSSRTSVMLSVCEQMSDMSVCISTV